MKNTDKRSASVGMFYLYTMIIITLLLVMASCKTTKYHTCDAYKTHYKPLKPEKHKNHHHKLCDAYN
jgi:hypothetical protein